MIQGSINKYSYGVFQPRYGTHGSQNPEKFLGIDFPCIICIICIKWRPDAIRDVSRDIVCLYHDVSRTAHGRHKRDTTIRVPASMYQLVSPHFSCVKSTGYVSDTR